MHIGSTEFLTRSQSLVPTRNDIFTSQSPPASIGTATYPPSSTSKYQISPTFSLPPSSRPGGLTAVFLFQPRRVSQWMDGSQASCPPCMKESLGDKSTAPPPRSSSVVSAQTRALPAETKKPVCLLSPHVEPTAGTAARHGQFDPRLPFPKRLPTLSTIAEFGALCMVSMRCLQFGTRLIGVSGGVEDV